MSRLLRLAWRQLLRESRAAELRVLALSLVIAVAASSAIGHFSERLNGAMLLRASEFLGADLSLNGTRPASEQQRQAGLELGLMRAEVVEFSSMVGTDQAMQLASVKAVDTHYPLRGALRSRTQLDGPELIGGQPQAGEIWAQARLLSALNLKLGDAIDVGYATLKLTRVLTHEPDNATDFYSLTPRALINLADLPATQVVQPGSRVRYKTLWAGEPQALSHYRSAMQASLASHQRLQDAKAGNQQIGKALSRAQNYLNLTALVAVLLCAVAVALAANQFAKRRLDASALLRCLGLTRAQSLLVYGFELFILGVGASLIGAALGFAAQAGLLHLLQGLVPQTLPGTSLYPALAGVATGLVALAGFAIAPLWALGAVPPIRVLRRDSLPVASSTWLAYLGALSALGWLMWRLSLDSAMTAGLLGGALLAALVLGALLLASLKLLRRLLQNASLAWRLGLGQLLRHPLSAAGQALAFGLILFAMSLIALLRTELLDNWQAQLPDKAPNHFALNIQPHEREAFAQAVQALTATAAPVYPVVPGRLTSINGQSVIDAVSKEAPSDSALRRDLSLTWSAELPLGNQLLAGTWWQANQPSQAVPGVSVEAKLADRLKLKLGDRLGFTIAGTLYEAKVQSLRTVNWESFTPNFYMVFEPGTLTDVPTSYLTSFYLAQDQAPALLGLSRRFAGVTLLEVDALLSQLRAIIAQVTLAVEYVLVFVLAAGFCVLLAGVQVTLDERIRQAALLRALGASGTLINRARVFEFAVLGASAGLLAAIACELSCWVLYRFVLDIPWQAHPSLLLLPVLGALLISAAGSFGTRKALSTSPLQVLRQG